MFAKLFSDFISPCSPLDTQYKIRRFAEIFKGTSAGAAKAWDNRQQNALPDIGKGRPLKLDMGLLGPNASMAAYNASMINGTDDANVTEETILAKLAPADAAEIRSLTIKAKGGPTSQQVYTDENGQYTKMSTHKDPLTGELVTEPRFMLHEKIAQKYINEQALKNARPPQGTRPTFVLLGGRGGSGKSSFTNGTIKEFKAEQFIKLDSDEIKEMLKPPYAGWNAYSVHDESSVIFEHMTDMLRSQRVNFIQDITMKSLNVEKTLLSTKSEGYDIQGHYMYLPRQVSALRAQQRYLGREHRGRLVPAKVILDDMRHNEEVFDALKKNFSAWSAWDNQGSAPVLLSRNGA